MNSPAGAFFEMPFKSTFPEPANVLARASRYFWSNPARIPDDRSYGRRVRIHDSGPGTRQRKSVGLLLTSGPGRRHPVKPRAVGAPGSAGLRA